MFLPVGEGHPKDVTCWLTLKLGLVNQRLLIPFYYPGNLWSVINDTALKDQCVVEIICTEYMTEPH